MNYLRKVVITLIVFSAAVSAAQSSSVKLSPVWIKNKSIENVQVWRNSQNSAQKISQLHFQLKNSLHVATADYDSFVKVLEAYHNFQLAPFGFKNWGVSEYGVQSEKGKIRLRLRGRYEGPGMNTVYFDETETIQGLEVDAVTFYSDGKIIDAKAVNVILGRSSARGPADADEVQAENLMVTEPDENAPPVCVECERDLNPPLTKTTKTVGDVLKHMGNRNDVCRGVNPSRRDWIGLAGAEPWSWKRTLKHQLQVATLRDEVLTCLKGIITSFVNSARSFVALGAHIAHGTKKFEHWIFHRRGHGSAEKVTESEISAGEYAESDVSAAGDVAAEKVSEAQKPESRGEKIKNAVKADTAQAKHQLEQALQGNLITKVDDALNVVVSEQMCKSIEERFVDVCRQLVLSPLGALPMEGLQGAMYSQTIGMVGESVGAITQNGFAAEAADAIARKILPKKSPDGLNLTSAEKMPPEALKAAQDPDLHWYVHPFTISKLEMARISYVKDGVATNQIVYRLKKAGQDQLFFGTGNPPATERLNKLFDQKQSETPNYDPLAPKNAVFLETEPGFFKRVNAADGVSLTDGQAKKLSERLTAGGSELGKYITVIQAVGYRAVTERNMHELFSKLNPVDPANEVEVKKAQQIEHQRVDALENREDLLENVNKLVLKTDDVLKSDFLKQVSEVIHGDTDLPLINSYERLTRDLAKKSGSTFGSRVEDLVEDKVKKGLIGAGEAQAASACINGAQATAPCESLILKMAPPK